MYAPIVSVIFAYIYLGTFNRMLADDYCVVYYGERLGLFRSIWYWYITWHGGYSASALDWFLSFLGKDLLPWTTFLYLGTLTVTTSGVVYLAAFEAPVPKSIFEVSLLLGMLQTFVLLVAAPAVPQSLIWWTGARGYFAPLIGLALYFLIFFLFSIRKLVPWQRIFCYIISFVLAFLNGGFAEVYTPVQFILFWGLIVSGWSSNKLLKRDLYFLCVGAVGSSLALVVMIAAPGNVLRQEFFPEVPDIFTILTISFQSFFEFLKSVLFAQPIAPVAWGAMLLSGWLGLIYKDSIRKSLSKPLGAFAVLVVGNVLAFGSFIPSVYGTAEAPHPRTLIVSMFFFFCGVIGFGLLIGGWLGKLRRQRKDILNMLIAFAFSLITYSSVSELSILLSAHDVYVEFAEKWDAVDMEIKDAIKAGGTQVTIPLMVNWANLEHPTDNPRYWPNRCYSRYYGIQIISPAFEP